jgi:hypothetical protein
MAISISMLPEILRPKETKVEEDGPPEWAKKYVYHRTKGLSYDSYTYPIPQYYAQLVGNAYYFPDKFEKQ